MEIVQKGTLYLETFLAVSTLIMLCRNPTMQALEIQAISQSG